MANEIIESAGYTRALQLTKTIKVNAEIAQQSLYEVCKGLAEMKKDKLFKELGYDNFENYCENEVGIKRHQALKYATIGDKLSLNFVESTQQIGTEKLYLLAKLDEPVREEIQQNTDLESTSVKELKAKIADLRKANDRLLEKVDEAEKKAETSRKSEEKACGKLSILQTDTEFYKKKIEQLERDISENNSLEVQNLNAEKEELEAKIRELENRPVEVAVADNSEEIEELKKAAKEAENKYFAMIEKMSESDKEHADEVKRIKAEYEKKITETSKAETVTVSDDKAIFKAYLSNAIDASKRLIEFIKSHENEPFFKDKTRELFNSILGQI